MPLFFNIIVYLKVRLFFILLKCKEKEDCLGVAVCRRRRTKFGTEGDKEEAGP